MGRFFLLAFVLFGFMSYGQITGQLVEEKAIEIPNRAEANDSVYKAIKDYKAILIGEPHGVKESPEFLEGIVRTLLKNGKKVIVGLEIPGNGLTGWEKHSDLEHLKKTPFFTTASPDGRQCVAWADLLLHLKELNVPVVCFDLKGSLEHKKISYRDSLLFLNLNKGFNQDSNLVVVTMSGNISNMLKPYRNAPTMGWYLQNDPRSVLKDKPILSLNVLYGAGTTMHWLNDGYKLREVEGNAGFYAYASSYDNYLFIYPADEYEGILFTKTITASGPLNAK
jgi:hypothetical protein